MVEPAPEQRPGRRGRPRSPGSSVLTPPTGLPSVPDLDAVAPPPTVQRPDLPPAPPARSVVVEPCACGHPRESHDHYRPGTDCGTCGAVGCEEFRPEGGPVRRALRRMGLVP